MVNPLKPSSPNHHQWKWAVVKAKTYDRTDYDIVTDWVDKPTAIGFLKLLKEK